MLIENMKLAGGNKELGICFIKENKFKLFLLIVEGCLETAVLIEDKKSAFVSIFDSVGKTRGFSVNFIKNILLGLGKRIIIFSHPKEQLIFKSSLKNILSCRKLFDLWNYILENISVKVMRWSHFANTKEYPYKSYKNMEDFEDNPWSKIPKKDVNIEDFFNILLLREDMQYGGYLFGRTTLKESFIYQKKSISSIISYIRQLDFSNNQQENTIKIIDKFKLKFKYFMTNNIPLKRRKTEEFTVLTVKKK